MFEISLEENVKASSFIMVAWILTPFEVEEWDFWARAIDNESEEQWT